MDDSDSHKHRSVESMVTRDFELKRSGLDVLLFECHLNAQPVGERRVSVCVNVFGWGKPRRDSSASQNSIVINFLVTVVADCVRPQ